MRFLSLLLFLGACGSVNLAAIAQLSRLNPLTADPNGFVAAVVLPEEMDLPADGATLGFTWVSGDETIGGVFPLQRHTAFEGIEIVPRPAQQVLFFNLSPEDAAAIRRAQQEIILRQEAGADGKGSFSVFVAPCSRGVTDAPLISTFLRVEEGGPFLPLLKDFDIRQDLTQGQLSEVENCGA